MGNALVLSGGGAKGDFEVGALQFLYMNGFVAEVICSTSVGSVNAIQLAHGGTAATQRVAFDKLKTVWQTELTVDSDMYDEAAWLAAVPQQTRDAVMSLFSGNIDVPALLSEMVFFPPYLFGQIIKTGVDIGQALEALKGARSVFTLDPTRAKIVAVIDEAKVAGSGVALRLVVVSLDSGRVRFVTENGHVVEVDGTPVPGLDKTVCVNERADYDAAVTAVADAITTQHEAVGADIPKAAAAVAAARRALAAARASLESCMVRQPVKGLTVALVDGVLASSAIPCVFPPVDLGSESYVDGGVRWILPLKAALGFASEHIVAINAGTAGVPPSTIDFSTASILDIAERTVADILLWETQERHLEVAKAAAEKTGKHVWMVTPNLDLHDLLTIDPGLIDINIDYGFMCAADTLTAFPFGPLPAAPEVLHAGPPGAVPAPGVARPAVNIPPRQRPPRAQAGGWTDSPTDAEAARLADAITICRRLCWEAEFDTMGATRNHGPLAIRAGITLVPDPVALARVRLLKTLLGLLVIGRGGIGAALPPGALAWPDNWERHYWKVGDAPGVGLTPWDAFVSRAGQVAAAKRNVVMLARVVDDAKVFLLTGTKSWVTTPAALNKIDARGFAAVEVLPVEFRPIVDALPSAPDLH